MINHDDSLSFKNNEETKSDAFSEAPYEKSQIEMIQ